MLKSSPQELRSTGNLTVKKTLERLGSLLDKITTVVGIYCIVIYVSEYRPYWFYAYCAAALIWAVLWWTWTFIVEPFKEGLDEESDWKAVKQLLLRLLTSGRR